MRSPSPPRLNLSTCRRVWDLRYLPLHWHPLLWSVRSPSGFRWSSSSEDKLRFFHRTGVRSCSRWSWKYYSPSSWKIPLFPSYPDCTYKHCCPLWPADSSHLTQRLYRKGLQLPCLSVLSLRRHLTAAAHIRHPHIRWRQPFRPQARPVWMYIHPMGSCPSGCRPLLLRV